MTSRLNNGPLGRSIRKGLGSLVMAMALLTLTSSLAAAGVTLKLGDILVAEPGTSTISVIDPVTGTKTVVSQGGLLDPAHRAVAVALALNGDVIVVHRTTGLIRINPVTGAQSILSQGGFFKDPFAIAISKDTGEIFVADSSYDHDRPSINEAGKIIKVNAVSGAQTVIASGSACNSFPQNAACQNTTSAGSYISHPYGIAIDYSTSPDSLVVADMSSFNGKGAIVRVQISNGAQTLLWGPASASPAPVVAQATPLGCPMGVAVEPNGNILTTVFTYPVPPTPRDSATRRHVLWLRASGDFPRRSRESHADGRQQQRPRAGGQPLVLGGQRGERPLGTPASRHVGWHLVELDAELERDDRREHV